MVPLLMERDYSLSVNNAWSHFGGGLVPGRLLAPISKVFSAQDVSGNVLCTVAFLADWPIGMMVHAAQ